MSVNESMQRRPSWRWTQTTNQQRISCTIVSITVRWISWHHRRVALGRLSPSTTRISPMASWLMKVSSGAELARRFRGRSTTWRRWWGRATAKNDRTLWLEPRRLWCKTFLFSFVTFFFCFSSFFSLICPFYLHAIFLLRSLIFSQHNFECPCYLLVG